MGILLGILVLSFLIIIHELGHFLVAKAFKVKVNEFSLFMGPKLFSFQKGETVYSLRLIPLGGYVKMEGEEEESEDERAYNKKPVGVRAAIIAAGPIMNIVIALVIAFIMMAQTGFNTTQVKTVLPGSVAENAGIQVGDTLEKYNGKTIYQVGDLEVFAYPLTNESVDLQYERNGEKQKVNITPNREQDGYMLGFTPKDTANIDGSESNVVAEVTDKSPADEAGLKAGDKIVKLNGTEIKTRRDISKIVDQSEKKEITITVDRAGKIQDLKPITPVARKTSEWKAIGVEFEYSKGGFINTLKASINYTISTSRTIYYSIGWLFTQTVHLSDLSGPVGITSVISDVVRLSPSLMDKVINLLSMTAMISINLGLVNLIPFPALDGSKLVLLLIEKIRKKALNPEKEAMITMVGFVLLIVLLVYVTYNDVLKKILHL
ncbi:regulator of sigma E protease [Ruminiclostridium sufflavum DSM 19573]|uniref:Zinc metalloprotease n=1 Tax=Ruminiclostridium sufflavum DSM 19573 TaxID=1121337 RepID=A0A318XLU2_9FIRM|nr:RIP metalloprotease RseP [Ruminiclostridium sufflavum]PYG88407.1 regulator of sigma E protease [Ruminiclostridium sufflavum DSM 19573]